MLIGFSILYNLQIYCKIYWIFPNELKMSSVIGKWTMRNLFCKIITIIDTFSRIKVAENEGTGLNLRLQHNLVIINTFLPFLMNFFRTTFQKNRRTMDMLESRKKERLASTLLENSVHRNWNFHIRYIYFLALILATLWN